MSGIQTLPWDTPRMSSGAHEGFAFAPPLEPVLAQLCLPVLQGKIDASLLPEQSSLRQGRDRRKNPSGTPALQGAGWTMCLCCFPKAPPLPAFHLSAIPCLSLGAAGSSTKVSPADPVSLNPIPLSSSPSLLLLLPCLEMHTNIGVFSSTFAVQFCIRQTRLWESESCFCALSISLYALSKFEKGWIMFAVLLPVWLLPGDSGLVSAPEPVGDPWCSGDNSQQEHTGIPVAGIASLTSLLSWHPLVSVNMDFPHFFFCRLPFTMEKTWEKMLLLFCRGDSEGLGRLP